MLEILSRHLSNAIKRNAPESTVSPEVLEYAIGVRLNFVFTVLLSLLLGFITGKVLETIMSLIAFGVVRHFSGGYHMKSLTLCAIVSALIFSIIPLIPLNEGSITCITLISIFIYMIYAPNFFEELHGSTSRPYLKLISIVIVMANLLISSSILALAFFVQAILILPWKEVNKV